MYLKLQSNIYILYTIANVCLCVVGVLVK